MEILSIGDVSRRAQIATSAIRYYESVALLPAPERKNGRRYYDESILPRLAVIHLAQRAGFTIKEIQMFLNGFDSATLPSVRWQRLASRKLGELEEAIAQAQAMKALLENLMACQCQTIEQCASLSQKPYSPHEI